MKIKASALIAEARKHRGDGYVYGAVGQICTVALLKAREKLYGKKMGNGYYQLNGDYSKGRCAKWLGRWVSDCSGLIRACRRALGGGDVSASAHGIYCQCSTHGTISTMPDIPGIALFIADSGNGKLHMHHVGLYTGGGLVIQAANVGVGIYEAKRKKGWTHWGKLDWIEYDLGTGLGGGIGDGDNENGDGSTGKPDDPIFDPDHPPYLSYGDTGKQVAYMQSLLVKHGYKMPKSISKIGYYGMDGIWKSNLGKLFCETEKVVRQFQKDHRLVVDGVVGPITWAALLK